MKTDDLIGLLAADSVPVDRHTGTRRLSLAMGVGALLALAWVSAVFGLRADLAGVAATGPYVLKMGVPLAVAVLGAVAVFRLGHPGMRVDGVARWVTMPVLVLWVLALLVWGAAEPVQRISLVFGDTWRVCSLNVALTALPVLMMALWFLRGMAPTRPDWAGAAAGWFAGGVGAAAYALYCPEMDAPFLAVWYVLGMLVPAALGALVGPRLLRW